MFTTENSVMSTPYSPAGIFRERKWMPNINTPLTIVANISQPLWRKKAA